MDLFRFIFFRISIFILIFNWFGASSAALIIEKSLLILRTKARPWIIYVNFILVISITLQLYSLIEIHSFTTFFTFCWNIVVYLSCRLDLLCVILLITQGAHFYLIIWFSIFPDRSIIVISKNILFLNSTNNKRWIINLSVITILYTYLVRLHVWIYFLWSLRAYFW